MSGGSSNFMGTGDMNVRVGGDLTLSSGSPSSSTYEGGASGTLSCCHVVLLRGCRWCGQVQFPELTSTSTQPQPGGGCYGSVSFQVNGGPPNMGGLVVENVWEGEIIIGGDLRVTGCNAGSSVEGSGGQSDVVSMVSGLCAALFRTAVV